MTGFSDITEEEALAKGASIVFQKPLRFKDLQKFLDEQLGPVVATTADAE